MDDSTVCIWRLSNENIIGATLRSGKNYTTCIALSNDGSRVVSASEDKPLREWDVSMANTNTRKNSPPVGEEEEKRLFALSMSMNGRMAVAGHNDSSIHIWDIETGLLRENDIHNCNKSVEVIAIRVDSQYIVSR